MKILLKTFKFLYFFTIFLYLPLQARLLDVQISLDASEKNENNPISSAFGIGLCQKSVPIITTSHIFYNILKARQFGNPNFTPIQIDQNWDIYKLKYSEDFYLFIPKAYKQSIINQYDTPAFRDIVAKLGVRDSIEEILIGFKINPASNVFQQVTLVEYDTPAKIEAIKHGYYLIDSKQLYKMFTQGKEEINGLWNIVLDGHGYYPSGLKPNLTINDLIRTVEGSSASLVSISLSEFRDLIQFFIKKINVNFLYYMTCYAGDINLILPYITSLVNPLGRVIGGLQKPNFTIVSGALTSEPVYVNEKEALKMCNNQVTKSNIPKGYINYGLFFELLNKYGKKEGIRPTLYKDKELKEILTAITPRVKDKQDPHGISALPSVMFPLTDIFRAVALDDTISIISNVLEKKHELEKKPIKIKDKDVILIYPQNVSIPLEINISAGRSVPSMVSMLPGLNINKFESITTNINFYDFVNTVLGSTTPVFYKYFFIKKLKINNFGLHKLAGYSEGPIELTDVLILLRGYQDYAIVTILYTGPDLNVNEYLYWKNPYSQVALGKINQIISNNYFLNTLYNYFYINKDKERLRTGFIFDELKKLLSPEEIKILESPQHTTPSSPHLADQRKFNQTINKLNLFINLSSKINNIKNVNRKKQLTKQLRSIRRNIINQFDLNIKNQKGQTPLMMRPNLIPFLKELPKNKARIIANAKDNDNKTILNYLIESKNNLNVQYYRILINSGAKVTRQNIKEFGQKTKARGPKFKKIMKLLRQAL